MPFGLLSFKRKFLATVDPISIIANGNLDDRINSRKRMRIEEPTSIREVESPSSQDACAAGNQNAESLPGEEGKQAEETMEEELKAKLREFEDTAVRVKKEAERTSAKTKKLLEEDMSCMVCQEVIQNPQTLQCGHSACYACLRKWWTKPPTEDDGAPIVDTEAESDFDEENTATDETNLRNAAPAPRPRRRHRFSSAVNREKRCPYCNEVLKRRPVPNFRIRNTLETINRHLSSLPPHIQTRRESRRRDLWHGIFHETYNETVSVHVVTAEEDVAAREMEREQAFADGRAAGAVEVRTERARRQNEARRRAAMPIPLQELDFWRGNPPRAD